MAVYAQASEAWRGLEIGEKITSNQMLERLGLDQTVRATVSSFLSRQVLKGTAIKDGQLDGLVLYRKVEAAEDRRGKRRREEREVTDRDIGRAVLTTIDTLKAQLRSEREMVKDLVEENKQLKDLYHKAQTRILELNEELQKRGPTREVKLSDLRDMTK